MKILKKNFRAGLTFIELALALAILVLIISISLTSFYNMNKSQALDKDILLVEAVLGEAKSSAVSSKGFSDYGVHFDQDKLILFAGSIFDQNNISNVIYPLSNYSKISQVYLSGSSSEVVFQNVSGETDAAGFILVSLKNDSLSSSTINIFSTGAIERK